jgi:hypothetical protein
MSILYGSGAEWEKSYLALDAEDGEADVALDAIGLDVVDLLAAGSEAEDHHFCPLGHVLVDCDGLHLPPLRRLQQCF